MPKAEKPKESRGKAKTMQKKLLEEIPDIINEHPDFIVDGHRLVLHDINSGSATLTWQTVDQARSGLIYDEGTKKFKNLPAITKAMEEFRSAVENTNAYREFVKIVTRK